MPVTISFSTAGSFTVEDDGIPGNATSIIRRDSDGAVLAVIPHPADELILRAIVPGVNLTLNITDSFGSAALRVGSLTDPGESPDAIVVKTFRSAGNLTLVSNGSITEGGSDLAADLVAGAIILSAVSGVGTAGNAIETQTDEIEAETTTGGINIRNVGNLLVGGFSGSVDGLDVVTSGDIRLVNLGSITLRDETSFDSVHGGETDGDVILTANGFDSDLTSSVDQSSIIAPRGSIFLTAGRDISFGLAGTEFGNDVRANEDIVVKAGRDFLLSGFADFFANGILGTTDGNIEVTAGRNVELLDDTGTSASLATLGTGGNVVITTGPNGVLRIEPPSTNAISSGGAVILAADRMIIGGAAGITASGDVILRPVTDGRAILLGSLSDGGASLELSDGELDRVFTSGTLILGSAATGPIQVGAPIAPASATNFALFTGTDIFADLSLSAAGTLSLVAGDNIYQLGGSTFTANLVNARVDELGGDGGAGGIANLLGTIVAATVLLEGNVQADNIAGTGAAESLSGFGGNDVLSGGAGGDSLDGGTGADQMAGGDGSDTYFVDNDGDQVFETDPDTGVGGTDTVNSSVTFDLAGMFVETLNLTGSAAIDGIGNDQANVINGNSAANRLEGGLGADTLDGAGGADTMVGGDGDDIYFVNAAGDIVAESVVNPAVGGFDTVNSNVTFSLVGRFVETLNLTGTAAINGIGNGQANVINGNSAANRLEGGGGADTLKGAGGNDTMVGGSGNDTYFVNAAGDIVEESVKDPNVGGFDTVNSNVTYSLVGRFVETLNLTGTDNINGTGNGQSNIIVGNAGANRIDGGLGADDLTGGGGIDRFTFRTALTSVDAILDFDLAKDLILLDDAIFTGSGSPGALTEPRFRSGTAALDSNDRIIHDPATGNIFFDPDGNGAQAATLFATVTPGLVLSNTDFVIF